MGDVLKLPSGAAVTFQIRIRQVTAGRVEVVKDGEIVPVLANSALTESDQSVSFIWKSDSSRHWFRINVRSDDGKLLLVGNPIYINFE
jgi:hypothetical protein